jgi:hypothetical protein
MQLRGGIFRGIEFKKDLFDYDYQQVLNRATALGYSLPTASQQIKENALMVAIKAAFGVTSLKSSSNISSVPILQMLMFATNGDSDYATISWRDPFNSARQATKVNSPSFTALSGFNGNGTSSYLNSRVNQRDDVTQSNFALSARAFVNSARNTDFILGTRNTNTVGAPRTIVNSRAAADNFGYGVTYDTSLGTIQTAETDATKRFTIQRPDSSNIQKSQNGENFVNTSRSLTSFTNSVNIGLLAELRGGTSPEGYSIRGISYFICYTRALTNTENANIDTALANYLS